MNPLLRKIAVIIGIGILFVSMFWSQDGFNFDLAGDSGGTDMAIFIGWFLAVAVTVIQFVFSTNFKDLNASLIFFGIVAYSYSIYTNYLGVTHFQGGASNPIGAWILALVLDGVPEPLIAWGLYESLQGDWIGNLIKVSTLAPAKGGSVQNQSQPKRDLPNNLPRKSSPGQGFQQKPKNNGNYRPQSHTRGDMEVPEFLTDEFRKNRLG